MRHAPPHWATKRLRTVVFFDPEIIEPTMLPGIGYRSCPNLRDVISERVPVRNRKFVSHMPRMARIAIATLLLLSAMVVFAEPKCRVEWVAPTGEHGHSDWSTYKDALAGAQLSALIGIPAGVVCKRSRFSERNHPMAKKSKLRVLKDAGARRAEAMLPSRFPLNRQPTTNQLRAYAKKIADVSLARARREVKEAASVKV